MAQLKITSAMWQALLNTGASKVAPTTYLNSVYIMQGGVPSTGEAYQMSTSSFSATYGANILISYNVNTTLSLATNVAKNLELAGSAATKTGVATWACVVIGSGSGATERLFIGDVTDAYGTGFLTMNDTSITIGETYKILGLQLSFGNEYTF